MNKRILISAVLALTACDDDSPPDWVVASSGTPSERLNMNVYVVSDDGETADTEISVYFYRFSKDGYLQYVELQGDDELLLDTPTLSTVMTGTRYPDGRDPMLVFYEDAVPEVAPATALQLQLVRDGSSVQDVQTTLLQETPFELSFDAESLTPDDTVTAQWTAVEGYQYRLTFRFSCEGADGNPVGFHVHYPNHQHEDELVSPFSLDLGQFSAPPEGAANCELQSVLTAKEDQSADQLMDIDHLEVFAARKQSITTELVNE